MSRIDDYDWSKGTAEAHLDIARKADAEQLRLIARRYDWRLFPEDVLGWVMAQKAIDLGTALTCFMNGEPERFNYIPKRDVPDRYHSACRMLDNLCLRVNSGYYLFTPGHDVEQSKRLKNWMTYQDADRRENRRGRWILDERILETMNANALKLQPGAAAAPSHRQSSLLKDVFSPVMELGVSREYLKYLPTDK